MVREVRLEGICIFFRLNKFNFYKIFYIIKMFIEGKYGTVVFVCNNRYITIYKIYGFDI